MGLIKAKFLIEFMFFALESLYSMDVVFYRLYFSVLVILVHVCLFAVFIWQKSHSNISNLKRLLEFMLQCISYALTQDEIKSDQIQIFDRV